MLPTDTSCWHCGQVRAGQQAAPARIREEMVVEPLPFSQTAVIAYGSLTLAILIVIILLMRSLSQQPLIAINASQARERSWSIITDSQQRFTLDLPPEWDWSEPKDGAPFEAKLANYEGWETAVTPLDKEAIQMLAIAPETEQAPLRLLAIARNIQIHELSYIQIQELVEQNGFTVSEIEETTSFFGVRQIHLRLETETLQCAQQYTLDPENSYLFSICTPPNQYLRQIRTIEAIQSGFQTLMRN